MLLQIRLFQWVTTRYSATSIIRTFGYPNTFARSERVRIIGVALYKVILSITHGLTFLSVISLDSSNYEEGNV